MLYIFNYNIKENRMKEFQKFIKENEKAFAEHAPKGWKFMGTYFYVLGFGPYHAADACMRMRIFFLFFQRNNQKPVRCMSFCEGTLLIHMSYS